MSAVSGNGGGLFIQTTYPGSADDIPLDPAQFHSASNVSIPVGKWSLNKNKRLQEITRTWHTNGTRYGKTVGDPSFSIEVPFDDAAVLEDKGIDQGIIIPLVLLKVGKAQSAGEPLYYMVLQPTVDTVEPVCDSNNDIVRYVVSFKGGDVSGPKTLTGLGITVP